MFRAITGTLFGECWRTAIGEPILTSTPLNWEESHWGSIVFSDWEQEEQELMSHHAQVTDSFIFGASICASGSVGLNRGHAVCLLLHCVVDRIVNTTLVLCHPHLTLEWVPIVFIGNETIGFKNTWQQYLVY